MQQKIISITMAVKITTHNHGRENYNTKSSAKNYHIRIYLLLLIQTNILHIENLKIKGLDMKFSCFYFSFKKKKKKNNNNNNNNNKRIKHVLIKHNWLKRSKSFCLEFKIIQESEYQA